MPPRPAPGDEDFQETGVVETNDGQNTCTWEWRPDLSSANPWKCVSEQCDEGYRCAPPAGSGSFIGEIVVTNCALKSANE